MKPRKPRVGIDTEQRCDDLDAARGAFKAHDGTPGYHTGFADGAAYARQGQADAVREARRADLERIRRSRTTGSVNAVIDAIEAELREQSGGGDGA